MSLFDVSFQSIITLGMYTCNTRYHDVIRRLFDLYSSRANNEDRSQGQASPFSHDSSSPYGGNADDSDVDFDNISPLRSERDPASHQRSSTEEPRAHSEIPQGHSAAAGTCSTDDDRLPLGRRRSTSPSPRVLFAPISEQRVHAAPAATSSGRHLFGMRSDAPVQEALKSTHERLAQTLAMQRKRLLEHHDQGMFCRFFGHILGYSTGSIA